MVMHIINKKKNYYLHNNNTIIISALWFMYEKFTFRNKILIVFDNNYYCNWIPTPYCTFSEWYKQVLNNNNNNNIKRIITILIYAFLWNHKRIYTVEHTVFSVYISRTRSPRENNIIIILSVRNFKHKIKIYFTSRNKTHQRFFVART